MVKAKEIPQDKKGFVAKRIEGEFLRSSNDKFNNNRLRDDSDKDNALTENMFHLLN